MRWRRRLPAVLICSLLLAVTMASPALADPIGDAVKSATAGQSNPMLSWIQLQDSHGVSVWQYELSIDRGNPVSAADKWFWSKWVDNAWQFYRDGVVVAIWMLRWVLDFGWLDPVVAATTPIAESLHTTVGMLGLVGFFLTVSGVVGAIYIFNRRAATGVWELMAAVLVAAALGTVLVNPAGLLLSKPDGLAYRVHDTSLAFVAQMAQTPQLKASGQTDAITSDLIVTFLRQPLELVNFGAVIDGTECESAYDEVLKSGPHAWGSEIRDKVASCSAKAGDWASTPSPSMFSATSALYPATFIVLTLAIAIGGAVLMAGLNLAYLSVKATVTTVVGVLPGEARRPLLGTVADVVIALGTFLFSFVFLAIFLKAVQLILGGSGAMSAPQKIFVTDLFLVGGLVIYLVNRKRIKASAHRLRELLARRPGGSLSSAPPPTRLNTAAAVSAAASAAHLARGWMRHRGASAGGGGAYRPIMPGGGGPGGGGPGGGGPGGGGPAGGGPAGGGPAGGGRSGGGRSGGAVLTGRVLTGAAEAVLGHATHGASTVTLSAVRMLRRPKPRPDPGPGVQRVGASPVRRALPPVPSGRELPVAERHGGALVLPPGPSAAPPQRPRPSRGPQVPQPGSRSSQSRMSAQHSSRPAPRRTGRRGGR
jgi:hypothetical protein